MAPFLVTHSTHLFFFRQVLWALSVSVFVVVPVVKVPAPAAPAAMVVPNGPRRAEMRLMGHNLSTGH